MALCRVDVEVTWGDVPLASVRASLPARLDDVLREAGVHIGEKLTVEVGPGGCVVVRDAVRRIRASSSADAPAAWTTAGLTFCARPAGEHVVLPSRRADIAWLAAIACAALLVFGAGALVRSSPPRARNGAARRATLAALARWAARSAPTASHPTRAPASETALAGAPEDDPSEDLPDSRATRVAPAPQALTPIAAVAQRGILALDLLSPRTVRTLDRVALAFGSMAGAPIYRAEPDDDRFHYGMIAPPGIGAGAGCEPGTDCGVVRVRVTIGGPWRPRAAAIAHAAMQARVTAPPVIRAAPPERGELTMPYVQQRVRRDLLPDVVRCYADVLEQSGDLPSGRVVTRFEVSTEGRVAAAAIVSSAIARPDVEACVLRVLRGATFPPSAAGASVTYPFVFSSLMPDR